MAVSLAVVALVVVAAGWAVTTVVRSVGSETGQQAITAARKR
ncbi:DUF6251 family protein [Nonomuraea sp. NPDC003707]